jgi:hypothetical protein
MNKKRMLQTLCAMDKRLESFLGVDWFAFEGHDLWDIADCEQNTMQRIRIANQFGRYDAHLVRNRNDVVIQLLTDTRVFTRLGDADGLEKWKELKRTDRPEFTQTKHVSNTTIGQYKYHTWTLLHEPSNQSLTFVSTTDENNTNPLPWRNPA